MKKIVAGFMVFLIGICSYFPVSANEIPDISAKSAVVINAQTGEVLFNKNAQQKLPMASTTKIMTVILSIENGDLDNTFTVDENAVKTEGSSMGLKENDKVTMRDLCYGMMLPSGNDAANCAAVRVAGTVDKFVELMNKKAKEIGLSSTHFVTPSGLDDDTDEHYSTALDMAMLTRYAMNNPTFRDICGTQQVKLNFGNPPYDRWLINTNKLLKNCEGVTGVKTGFTDKARRCLVSCCKRNGAELVCVTLNDPDDWKDHSLLYNNCFRFMSEQILPVECKNFKLDVVGGKQDTVNCATNSCKAVLVNGRANRVKTVVRLPKFVYAPIEENQQVGSIDYYYEGIKIAETPIYATENTAFAREIEKGFLEDLKSKICAIIAR